MKVLNLAQPCPALLRAMEMPQGVQSLVPWTSSNPLPSTSSQWCVDRASAHVLGI